MKRLNRMPEIGTGLRSGTKKSRMGDKVVSIARRGQAIYDARLKSRLEPKHNGKLVAIDVETGDYVVGDDALVAGDQLRRRRRDVVSYVVRIGSRAVYKLG